MIIDVYIYYITASLELQGYRAQQIINLGRPGRAKLQVSDEALLRSMQEQFARMKETGTNRLLFPPQTPAIKHHFEPPLVSRYWTEACNDLIARVTRL